MNNKGTDQTAPMHRLVCDFVVHMKQTQFSINEAHILSKSHHGTKIFEYCTYPAGRVTYNFHSSCRHMYLFFKSVCNKEHKGMICYMTSSRISFKITRPTGLVVWKELLVLSRFHSQLRADKWNFCPLHTIHVHIIRDTSKACQI